MSLLDPRLFFVVVIVALLFPSQTVQEQEALGPPQRALMRKSLRNAQQRLEQSGLEGEKLESDFKLILDTSQQLYDLDHPQGTVPILAASAWYALRSTKTRDLTDEIRERNESFDEGNESTRLSAFLNASASLIYLKITSEPEGATIEVSGLTWSDPTNTSFFVDEGKQEIVVKRSGYETITAEIDVKRGQSNERHFVLTPK